MVSGLAILLAHPRLYWGETGAVGTSSLIDLPLPFLREIPIRGPGRYLHFLSAWVCVLAGLYYVLVGLLSGHLRNNLLPARADLRSDRIVQIVSNHLQLRRPTEEESYNVLQQLTYLGVVFVLFPLIVWTGLAMSPAVTSVFPRLATVVGGRPVTAEWFNKFSALKMFFRFALSRGYATRNPLPLSQPKNPRQFRPYLYSREEVQKMIRVVDNRHRNRF